MKHYVTMNIGLRKAERMWRNGRRTRLKILRGQPRVGSSPTIRRKKKQLILCEIKDLAVFSFLSCLSFSALLLTRNKLCIIIYA